MVSTERAADVVQLQEDEYGENGDDDDEEEVVDDGLGEGELAAAGSRLVLLVAAVALLVLVIVAVLVAALAAFPVAVVFVPAEEKPGFEFGPNFLTLSIIRLPLTLLHLFRFPLRAWPSRRGWRYLRDVSSAEIRYSQPPR